MTTIADTQQPNKSVFQVEDPIFFAKTEIPTEIADKTNVNHKETRAPRDPIVTSKCSHKTHPPAGYTAHNETTKIILFSGEHWDSQHTSITK